MGWQIEGMAIDCLGWRVVCCLGWSGAEAEEDPGKVMIPVSSGGAGTKGVLETAVEALDEAVGLGVVGGGRMVLDVKQLSKLMPKRRGELRPTISCDVERDAMAGDPVAHEGGCAVCGGGGGERNGVGPAGGAVDDGEKVCMAS